MSAAVLLGPAAALAATDTYSSVSGGAQSTAGGFGSSVSGGLNRDNAVGQYDWAAGNLFQDL